MRYIIYCRKSSESEDRQIMSLDAQEKELIKIAERDNLEVVKILRESMSAKSPGRPVFAQVMKLISSGKADGIICWKLDRLARNPVDGGSISWLLQNSQIQHIKTSDRDYWPKDNVLMMSVEFGMSNQYIRDLSENVKRGNREKLRQGGWPYPVPFGYYRDSADKNLYINKNQAHWIVRIFELYASGTKSLEDISDMLYEEGLRTKSGNKVYLGHIHRILFKKIYYGVLSKDGVDYIGKHEPIISKELFDKAHAVLEQASRPRTKTHFFPLRGPMRCKTCGCMLTASLKKGFRYYYCTNGKGICEQGQSYMREEYITEKLANQFADIAFDEELIEMMYEAAKQKIGISNNRIEQLTGGLLNELNLLKERESRLTDGFASGSIRTDLYDDKIRELNNSRIELERQLNQVKNKPESSIATLERTKEVFLEAKNAKNQFLMAKDSKRHQMLNTLLWNAWFQNKEIQEIQYKKPYSLMASTPKNADFLLMSGCRESNSV